MVQDSWRLINHHQDESFVNKTKGMHVKKKTKKKTLTLKADSNLTSAFNS